jgi:hypothetical protein
MVVRVFDGKGWVHKDLNMNVLGEVELQYPPPTTVSSSSWKSQPPKKPEHRELSNMNDAPPVEKQHEHTQQSKAVPGPPQKFAILDTNVLVKPAGRFMTGVYEMPFKFLLLGVGGAALLETYRGHFIRVTYQLSIEIERSVFQRTLETTMEFVVRFPPTTNASISIPTDNLSNDPNATSNNFDSSEPCSIQLTQDSCITIPTSFVTALSPRDNDLLMQVNGRLDRSSYSLGRPITGELTIHECSVSIRNIYIRLKRIETMEFPHLWKKDILLSSHPKIQENRRISTPPTAMSQVCHQELADGDPPRHMAIPISMCLPELLVCPTTTTSAFCVEYQVEIAIRLEDGRIVKEFYPIHLFR